MYNIVLKHHYTIQTSARFIRNREQQRRRLFEIARDRLKSSVEEVRKADALSLGPCHGEDQVLVLYGGESGQALLGHGQPFVSLAE